MKQGKLWINYEQYKKLKEYREYLERKLCAWTFYGIHPGEYPEFEEFKGSNKDRSISFKDSWEVPKRPRNTALFGLKEANHILQDKAMPIPSEGSFSITLSKSWDKASQDWYSSCSADKSKIRLSQHLSDYIRLDGRI